MGCLLDLFTHRKISEINFYCQNFFIKNISSTLFKSTSSKAEVESCHKCMDKQKKKFFFNNMIAAFM